jgi:hypothetical protein
MVTTPPLTDEQMDRLRSIPELDPQNPMRIYSVPGWPLQCRAMPKRGKRNGLAVQCRSHALPFRRVCRVHGGLLPNAVEAAEKRREVWESVLRGDPPPSTSRGADGRNGDLWRDRKIPPKKRRPRKPREVPELVTIAESTIRPAPSWPPSAEEVAYLRNSGIAYTSG